MLTMSWYNDITNTVGGKLNEIGGNIRDAASKTAKEIKTALDPALNRLEKAGLLKGGARAPSKTISRSNVNFSNRISKTIEEDWRVRVSMSDSVAAKFYGDSSNDVMSPLSATKGVIFPYTPQIQVTYQANYTPQRLTHSNYQTFYYEASEVQAISITADFTVQNQEEARYVLACIYFFRAATKMFYGSGTGLNDTPGSDPSGHSNTIGNPPPIVFLNGYGERYFPNVPCIVTQFSHTMPSDVDYIETDYRYAQENTSAYKPLSTTRIPTVSQITVLLQPVYSKNAMAGFSLEKFASGGLLKDGFL